jgi:predicted negative regulator of RcsB-dependent stress response
MTTHLVRHQKLTKRQIKEDPLVTAAFRSKEFWDEHGRIILIVGGALVIALVLGWLILGAREQAETRASGTLFRAELSVLQGDYQTAVQGLKELIENSPGTNAARRAMLLLGDSYAALANPREAATWYRKALDRAGSDRVLRRAARLGLAAALEDNRQFADAAPYYADLANEATGDNERGRALLGQARCLLAAGQAQKAGEALEAILALPGAEQPLQDAARVRLGELRATQSR